MEKICDKPPPSEKEEKREPDEDEVKLRGLKSPKEAKKNYRLSGYLYKLSGSGRSYVRSLSGFSSSSKKRWFVYSEKTCKLYYYKSENDPEPLGEIDIALATFYYDPDSVKDSKLDGQFKIR